MSYNSQMPAMPTEAKIDGNNKVRSLKTGEDGYKFLGLTKREMIAMHAMQGLMASVEHYDLACPQETARAAVAHADALLKELYK